MLEEGIDGVHILPAIPSPGQGGQLAELMAQAGLGIPPIGSRDKCHHYVAMPPHPHPHRDIAIWRPRVHHYRAESISQFTRDVNPYERRHRSDSQYNDSTASA